MIETEWVCSFCGQTVRPCLCANAGVAAKIYWERETQRMKEEAEKAALAVMPTHTQAIEYFGPDTFVKQNPASIIKLVTHDQSSATELLEELKEKLLASFNTELQRVRDELSKRGITRASNGEHNGHEVNGDS